jgi:hypothetical protein
MSGGLLGPRADADSVGVCSRTRCLVRRLPGSCLGHYHAARTLKTYSSATRAVPLDQFDGRLNPMTDV